MYSCAFSDGARRRRFSFFGAILLTAAMLWPAMAFGQISSVSPTQNALNMDINTNIIVTFDTDMDAATINQSSFIVQGRLTGLHPGAIDYNESTRTAIFDPTAGFAVGELVDVVLTTGIHSSSGTPLEKSFAWTFTTAVSSCSGHFASGVTYPTSGASLSATAADLNGDGHIDVATAENTGDVNVFFNMGDGILEAASIYPLNITPASICAADFDLDGDIDLATNGVTVLLNDGGGIFTDLTDYPAGGGSKMVFAEDFNGDGYFDLATADHDSDDVSIFLNTGDGSGGFAPRAVYKVTNCPDALYAADLDNDGDVDITLVSGCIDSVRVLFNSGAGTFSSGPSYYTGDVPISVWAANLNEDGYLDLAVANRNSYTISLFFNDGSGGMLSPIDYETHYHYPYFVSAADFNGDGLQDLAVAERLYHYLSVRNNLGGGSFSGEMRSRTENSPRTISAADFDGDGDLDLAMAGDYSSDLAIAEYLRCEVDSDGDGWCDPGYPGNEYLDDNCPYAFNGDQADADGDGVGNACDECTDTDGDGFGDPGYAANTCVEDNCPAIYNPDQDNPDGDNYGTACDNCPYAVNPAQSDRDRDGIGDECDECTDTDGDGYGDPGYEANTCPLDNCYFRFNPDQADSNGDGIGDACDSPANLVYIDAVHTDDPFQPVDTFYIGGIYRIRFSLRNAALLGGVELSFIITSHGAASYEMVDVGGFETSVSDIDFVTGIAGSRWMSGAANDGSCWDLGGTQVTYNPDGDYPNQILFGGAALNGGLEQGQLQPMLEAHIRPSGDWNDGIVGAICIDTLKYSVGEIIFVPGGTPAFNTPRCWPLKRVCGDPNGDGKINVADAVFMINYIFKGGRAPDPWQLGDANLDGVLNIADAVYLVQAVFGNGPMPERPEVPPAPGSLQR